MQETRLDLLNHAGDDGEGKGGGSGEEGTRWFDTINQRKESEEGEAATVSRHECKDLAARARAIDFSL